MAGWDPSDGGDPAAGAGDDGPDGWLAGLPADIAAEPAARPPVTGAPWEGPEAARAALADGGLADTMLPGWRLGRLLAEATRDG